ncbi:hypothetical protein CgunFtcFv8_020344 [Champsocephalus gunnari]|uniref:Uncharacterized protein n=1 Tax=Champsocephalus gunnari TaxID=52237 RepID=A0AAN8EAU1_CHAGU|nr:hypothetical protein CgunFtcFv8_020344 [Champsocephalus gunnari]
MTIIPFISLKYQHGVWTANGLKESDRPTTPPLSQRLPRLKDQTVCGGNRRSRLLFCFVRSKKDGVTCRVEAAGALPLRINTFTV